MELNLFIQTALQGTDRGIKRTLDGMTQDEICWRPGNEANCIGLILFHVARSEDMFIHTVLQNKPQSWETEKWYEKLNLPASETGSRYTVEQVSAFTPPDIKNLTAYSEAVRARTNEYLQALTPQECARKLTWGPMGETTVSNLITIVMNHAANHAGEISYIRGMKRGANK